MNEFVVPDPEVLCSTCRARYHREKMAVKLHGPITMLEKLCIACWREVVTEVVPPCDPEEALV
jgi:hypothetical protein